MTCRRDSARSMPDLSWLIKKPADHILEKENDTVSVIYTFG